MSAIIMWCLAHLNYWTIILFMTIESSFIPFPSEVVVPPAAWLAANGENGLNMIGVVIAATIGADLGAIINYVLARFLGRPVVYAFARSKFGHICLINEQKVMNAENFFERHGIASTFFGRLVPAIRQLISIPAGLAKMNFGKFIVFTTLGAGAWNAVLAAIGYSLSKVPGMRTTKDIADLSAQYSHTIGYAILGVIIIVLLVLIIKNAIKKHKAE
jgi:membrane protein DedA with SNARE-associated domain